jgi:arylsulfatase
MNFFCVMSGKLKLAFCAAALAFCASGSAAERPNVVVILADDLGWSDTSLMGGEIRTLNIEKLASRGTLFTHFYNTARCCPSRASLLTGLYPHQAGVGHMLWDTGYPGYSVRLTTDSVTMAEALRGAGYGTYMVGKWHLAEREPDPARPIGWPLQRGFDKFYGTLAGYGSYFDPATLCRGNTYITPENDPEYKPGQFYYTDAITDNAIKFMDEHRQSAADKPFFMYVAYTAAHWPLQVPEDSLSEYKGKYDAGYQAIRDARWKRQQEKGLVKDVTTSSPTTGDWDAVKDKAWETRRMEAYAATITRMDQGIGKILEHLKATGKLENTVVVYLQDNGACDEEFFQNRTAPPKNLHVMGPDELQTKTLPPMQTRDGKVVKTGEGVMAGPADSFLGYGPAWANVSDTPLYKVKHYTWEGGISTPMVISWPAGLPAKGDNRVDTPAHLVDLMPTVLQITGAEYPKTREGVQTKTLAGKSLLPLVTGEGEFHRDGYLFWEHEENRAVRDDKWKLVAEGPNPWQLFDMTTDRGETNNVAKEHPDIVKKMARAWDKYADENRVRPVGAHRLRSHNPDPAGTPSHLELKPGDVYPRVNAPALSGAGVKIVAKISKMAPDGVLIAQGAGTSGYALYMKDGRAHFSVRREKELLDVASAPVVEGQPGVIKATLTPRGRASIQVGENPPVKKDFYGPLLDTPNEPLSVGFDIDAPVGEYPPKFSFTGDLESVVLDVVTPK